MNHDLTAAEREEITMISDKLRKLVDRPQSHFSGGTYGEIINAAKEGNLALMRAYDRFLTPNRGTLHVKWMHVVISAYPEAPEMLSLTDEQVDAFLSMDSFITRLGNILGSASDAICLLLLEDIEQEQKIMTLLERGITHADAIRGILPLMDKVEPALIDGLL